MDGLAITVVFQEDLDFIEIENTKLSFYKLAGTNTIFAEMAETFQFLKKGFPSISETILSRNSKERQQLILNVNSSPSSTLTFNYVRMKSHSANLRYRDIDQRTLVGAKFLALEECIIFGCQLHKRMVSKLCWRTSMPV